MRSGYARTRLQRAAEALARPDGDIRNALYAAHLQLHTIHPEHLPDGEPRERLTRVHDGFTRVEDDGRTEGGVIQVIRGLDDAAAAALAAEIRGLWDCVATLPPEQATKASAGRPRGPAPAALVELRPLPAPRVRPGGRVLVVFGSTEGHTRKVAEFVAARLAAAGYAVDVRHAPRADECADLETFDGVIVAASIHWARYQSSVIGFAKAHHEVLNAKPTAFISVSLSAAGIAQPEPGSLDDYVEALRQETVWAPDAVHHVAGRIRHSGYDYFKRLAITLIAQDRGDPADPSHDYDMADYPALEAFVTAFLAGTAAEPARAAAFNHVAPSGGKHSGARMGP